MQRDRRGGEREGEQQQPGDRGGQPSFGPHGRQLLRRGHRRGGWCGDAHRTREGQRSGGAAGTAASAGAWPGGPGAGAVREDRGGLGVLAPPGVTGPLTGAHGDGLRRVLVLDSDPPCRRAAPVVARDAHRARRRTRPARTRDACPSAYPVCAGRARSRDSAGRGGRPRPPVRAPARARVTGANARCLYDHSSPAAKFERTCAGGPAPLRRKSHSVSVGPLTTVGARLALPDPHTAPVIRRSRGEVRRTCRTRAVLAGARCPASGRF